MNRYAVKTTIYVDADTDVEADNLVTEMLCGTEQMSKMWSVDEIEKKWEHAE